MLSFFTNRRLRLKQRDMAHKKLLCIAMKSVTVLRDTVHSMGWSCGYSAEFAPYEPYIRASDAIGNALFRSVHQNFHFYEGEEIFTGPQAHGEMEDVRTQLSRYDLGTFNPLRDQFLERPTHIDGLHLMGELLGFTMAGVDRNRRAARVEAGLGFPAGKG
jgi:hypothetical protein